MNQKEIIEKLKKELNAVILVHNYQPKEVQDIADFRGDSLELSRKAASTEADVIIFCGVDFMAETAKVLSPGKKVILPVKDATCPMANMITAQDLLEFKDQHPGAAVVTYVNTTAEVKAVSDICCTSSNAVKVVQSMKEDDIIFTPDKNLASYVAAQVDKNIILWPGFCIVHEGIKKDEVIKAKKEHPDAVLMVHPECRKEVRGLADYVVSTGQMFETVKKTDHKKFLIGTEEGIVYPLKQRFPDREFMPLRQDIVCRNMKKMTVEKVVQSMFAGVPEITVPEDIIKKAQKALQRMLEVV